MKDKKTRTLLTTLVCVGCVALIAVVLLVGNAMGLFTMARLKGELETLFGCNVDVVRFRKQLENTLFGESIHEDLILV